MKKYAKILCAILVVASLCATLLFTAGAQEGEPFTESMKITNYTANSISSGLDRYKSSVADNRINGISTGNNGQSSFLTIANGEGENPWIVAYANKNYSGKPSSNNNLYINANTSNSAPFTVSGAGTKGYYVVDFDVATHGEMLPGFDISVAMRRASDGSGFPFSGEIYIGNYITEKDAWTHVTILGDLKNNITKIYLNGEYVSDSVYAFNADQLSGDTQLVAQGFRIELTRNNIQTDVLAGQNAAFDNLAHRLFIDNSAELEAALSDGDITDWSAYTAGRGGELLPVVATVDGAEYRNFSNVSHAFNTNDTVDVEFLAQPLVPVEICANAKINTNGMDYTKLFKLIGGCKLEKVDGNIVTTSAPFVSNYVEQQPDFSGYSANSANVPTIYNATKGDAKGNLYDRFNMVSATSLKNINTLGYRSTTLISDTVTGTTIYRESANVTAGSTTTKEQNEYSNFNFTKVQLSYEAGKNEYIVVDFDYTYDGTLDGIFVQLIPRGNSGYHASAVSLKNLPVTAGEMAHITVVYDFTDNVAYFFVNGELTNSVAGGAINSGAHSKYLNNTESMRTEEFKLGSNSLSTVYFSNMNIRYFDVDANADTIDAAINSKDITRWDSNIYTSDYKIAQFPALATVDGVPYHSESTLEAALYGNKKTPAVVKILHQFDEVITVNCDATIYTYGQNVSFVDANENALKPDSKGIIRMDVPYMQIRAEKLVNGSDAQEIYNAIKSNIGGNLFSAFVPSEGKWGQAGYRSSSLVTNLETGDVLYRGFAMLDDKGALNASSAEYADMTFAATTLNYVAGHNSYVVVDFDFATDRTITDDVSVVLIPSAGATASTTGVVLKELGVLEGDSAHVTVVYDFTNNCVYTFVNGVFASTVENGVVADNSAYLAGTAITVDSLRLSTEGKTGAVCLDNVAIRSFTYAEAEDVLGGTVDAGDITVWSDSVYNSKYTTSKIPAVAVVDGREYGSVDTLNKILAIETNYVKSVEMKYSPETSVKIMTEVTVETNGLNIDLDWNTGLYEFDPGVERYRGTRTGLAYASTKFIYTTVGTAYTFKTIDADNCWSNASVAVWAYKVSNPGQTITFQDYDVVFYPYGEKMEPLENGKYVEGTNLNTVTWMEMTIQNETRYTISQTNDNYPVANSTEALKIYIANVRATSASYAATDMLYSANIGTEIEFVFYVNKSQTITNTGNVVTIDGKEYVAFTYKLAPHEIDKIITVNFEVANGAVVYNQQQEICFIDYIKALLEEGQVSKSLIVSLLNYANESHAFFYAGERMPAVTELINEYSAYLPGTDLNVEAADTSAINSIIRSASLRLNSVPEFVFRVARGFRGTITLSYNSLGVPVSETFYVNTLSCEQSITLKGMNVYDVASDITITITPYGSDTSVTGQYNLATYAQGLEDNAFAVALYNYSKIALQYHNANTDKHFPV